VTGTFREVAAMDAYNGHFYLLVCSYLPKHLYLSTRVLVQGL
jgi:hypothetical protein